LKKIQEWIIKVMAQFPDESPVEPKDFLSKWHNDCTVLMMEKYKIIRSDWAIVLEKEKGALWELIKAHYIFPSKYEELGKRTTILTIGRALQRFIPALKKFYIQPNISPLNWFGFIIPNKWNTFQQLHITPEAISLSNRMKELI
jgi:hypothetical protein